MKKICQWLLIFVFNLSFIAPPHVQAQVLDLPTAGRMISLTKPFVPVSLKGILIHPEQPFNFDFVVDSGNTGLKGNQLKSESMKLAKYFLAALTVPEQEIWVNLSPYEKDRMIAKDFGETTMGQGLLAQDYILKQLTASLTFPENALGKKFWDKVYQETQAKFGNVQIPVNTFNKVWIMPQAAQVYEHGNGAFVAEAKLKVMLEQDYLAISHNVIPAKAGISTASVASQVVRDIVIPALEKEVNEGSHFADLRQIYQAVILASWYKIRLKESLLGKLYVNQHKVNGVTKDDAKANEKIYQAYLAAFKKGAYSYIKEDVDPKTKQTIARKYISGGATVIGTDAAVLASLKNQNQASRGPELAAIGETVLVPFSAVIGDKATLSEENIALFEGMVENFLNQNEIYSSTLRNLLIDYLWGRDDYENTLRDALMAERKRSNSEIEGILQDALNLRDHHPHLAFHPAYAADSAMGWFSSKPLPDAKEIIANPGQLKDMTLQRLEQLKIKFTKGGTDPAAARALGLVNKSLDGISEANDEFLSRHQDAAMQIIEGLDQIRDTLKRQMVKTLDGGQEGLILAEGQPDQDLPQETAQNAVRLSALPGLTAVQGSYNEGNTKVIALVSKKDEKIDYKKYIPVLLRVVTAMKAIRQRILEYSNDDKKSHWAIDLEKYQSSVVDYLLGDMEESALMEFLKLNGTGFNLETEMSTTLKDVMSSFQKLEAELADSAQSSDLVGYDTRSRLNSKISGVLVALQSEEFKGIDIGINQPNIHKVVREFLSGEKSFNATVDEIVPLVRFEGTVTYKTQRVRQMLSKANILFSNAVMGVDNALAADPFGGIDLTQNGGLNVQIKRDAKGMPLPIQFQDLQKFHFKGLFPQVVGPITSVNLQALLGL
jgi:hypothetical protein